VWKTRGSSTEQEEVLLLQQQQQVVLFGCCACGVAAAVGRKEGKLKLLCVLLMPTCGLWRGRGASFLGSQIRIYLTKGDGKKLQNKIEKG
jgi:hypothetical protein